MPGLLLQLKSASRKVRSLTATKCPTLPSASDHSTRFSRGACGNGVVEEGEVCDDGNTTNEACDTTAADACLADCTLRMSTCGNGTLDPGEACDDGNTEDYDSCTTSCTVNDQNIGAPCRCEGRECSDTDPTAGRIIGCDNVVEPSDGSAVVACGRSIENRVYGITIYSAGGSCTLMAMSCTGTPFVCDRAPVVGDTTAFACPRGYVEGTDTRTVMGATLTTKICNKPCDGQNDCRWNEVEDSDSPWAGACGQWQCLLDPATGEGVCGDPRMVGP